MRRTQSTILDVVYETAKGLCTARVMDPVALREFDGLCLLSIESLRPEKIEHICEDSRIPGRHFRQQ